VESVEMTTMESLTRRIEQIAADRTSGASELLVEVMAVLADALAERRADPSGAKARARPTGHGPSWNAVRAALPRLTWSVSTLRSSRPCERPAR
jgi:hypothetical protein